MLELLGKIGLEIVQAIERNLPYAQVFLLIIWLLGCLIGLFHKRSSFLVLWSSFCILIETQILAYTIFPSDRAFWMALLGLIQAFFLSAWVSKQDTKRLEFTYNTNWYLSTLIICAGAFIRIWKLDEFPRPIEAEFFQSARVAFEVLETKRLFLVSTLSLDPGRYLYFLDLIHYELADLWAGLFYLFGVSIPVMQIVPTFFGLVSIVAIYLFGRRWLGRGIGESAAFLMAICPYMISLSRNLWAHVILSALYSLIVFYVLLLFLESPNIKKAIFTGVLCSLSVYLYRPCYIVLPIAACMIFIQLFDASWRHKAKKPLLFFGGMTLLFLLPFAYYNYIQSYAAHLSEISHFTDNPHVSLVHLLLLNLKAALQKVFYFGDHRMWEGVGMHGGVPGQPGFMHLPLTVALFAIGLGFIITGVTRRSVDRLLILWGSLSFIQQ